MNTKFLALKENNFLKMCKLYVGTVERFLINIMKINTPGLLIFILINFGNENPHPRDV